MLDTVRAAIADAMADGRGFDQYFDAYVMAVQDMDIENEILPLVKRESTEYLAAEAKLNRQVRKRRRGIRHDMPK